MSEIKPTPEEWMAREACRQHGYRFLALADDLSGDDPVPGFTYTEPGGDPAAPLWVSLEKACYTKWDGQP